MAGIRVLLPFSRLDQILSAQSAILPHPFQNETVSKGWCYYFEQADLARQQRDWRQVAQLGDLAFEIGFPDSAAKHVPEYVVFIEGYAHTDQWGRAMDLTLEAYMIEPFMEGMLCDAWDRIDPNTSDSSEKREALEMVDRKLGCE